jgi:hypothetical protein
MDALNEQISKSLDEIEALTEQFSKSKATEKAEDTISKAQDDEDLNAGDVSEDAPQEDNEEAPEQEAPQEDAPEDGQDESSEDSDADAEPEQDTDEDEDVEKSLEDDLKSNDSVKKALEVSEFLDTLVKSISEKVDGHSQAITKSLQAQENTQELVAKSLMGIVKGTKAVLEQNAELQKSVRVLNKRLKAIEEQPMVRKSVSSAQAINKSFEASAGNKPKPTNELSKSQISAKLMQAVEQGNTALTTDVLAFDATGKVETLSNEAKTILGL